MDDPFATLNEAAGNAPAPSSNPIDTLREAAYGPAAPTSQAPTGTLSAGQRFETGLGDLQYGLGQVTEHIAEKPLNWIRAGLRGAMRLGGASADTANQWFEDKSADDFDKIVQSREQDYQAARQAAGQTGIDWWRLGGEAANPINYLGAGAGAAETATGRIAQGALQGAAISGAQPITNAAPGSFWWDKAKTMAAGAAAGGAVSAVIEGAVPLLKGGIRYVKGVLSNPADTTAGEQIVNEAFRATGQDPNSIDLNVLDAMKKQVQEALNNGIKPEDISNTSVVNMAKANSLPVPIPLTQGMASRDPGLMTDEFNLMQLKGVGDPLRNRVQGINEAIKGNLDQLGAKSEQDVVSTGQEIQGKVQDFWNQMQDQKTQLYDAVKNSQGLAAKVNGQDAAREIRETLGSPEGMGAWYYLPSEMKQVLGDMEDGKMPMTVSNLQTLDKSWGQDAAAADGSTANAINQARKILGDADIDDDVGQDAMKAYQMAKQAHAQQMGMVTPKLLNDMPNPNYQPLLDDVVYGGAAPEKIFNDHFLNESGSQAGKNLQFLSQLDPDMKKTVGDTVFTEIKRQATGSANVENAPVSESVLRNWANSPQKSSVLENLLPSPQLNTFKNLSDTASNAKLFPAAAVPNRSGSGAAVLNAVGSVAKSYAKNIGGNIPGVKQVITPIFEGAAQVGRENAVNASLNAGVTLKSLLSSGGNATGKRLASRLITPAVVGAMNSDKKQPQPPQD